MSDYKPHILVADDDDRLRSLIKRFLSEQQFLVTAVADAAEARRKLACFVFDAMVLDVMMPGETGLSLLQSMAKEQPMPVLMLSAMGEAEDRIRGLEIGAEDYLVKPFEPKELVLRLRSVLRRNMAQQKNVENAIAFGEYRFDLETNSLTRAGEAIALTTGEAVLLKALAESAGSPVSREALAARMQGAASERSVDVQVTRLRKKIEPPHLQTVRGAGYVLYGRPVS